MNINILYFSILLMIICISCQKEESIDFLEPQPTNFNNEETFNKRYQGNYLNESDSSRLVILKDKILKISQTKLIFNRKDIDSTFKGDKFNNQEVQIELAKNNIQVTKFIGDTIYSIMTTKDTIFRISDKNICRLFKGSYFLNITDDKVTWKVQRLDLYKKTLSLGMIYPDDSLFVKMAVKEKSVIKDNSGSIISYQIKPSKKELKKLVKENYFTESEAWVKIK